MLRIGLELHFKAEGALVIAVFAQMPGLFIIAKTLDRIGNRDPDARFRFVRIGCIFEIARCELRFSLVASVGCLADYTAVIEQRQARR